MPVISLANAKGGSGKSTTALILACELSEEASVTLIDADPNRALVEWAELSGTPNPKRLSVRPTEGEREIQDEIDQAAQESQFVIVDLEGAASRLAAFAFAESDLVIVPSQEQAQDARRAIDTLKEVQRQGRALRREIPTALLFTRTKVAVKSRTNKHVAAELRSIEGLRVYECEIAERDAYAALFSIGGGLRQLDQKQVNGIERAVENAHAFARETIRIIRESRG
ncbi:MAG: chromosome partitioning protein ParA [Planctomycetaceae bacterium]|nr:chromosome partitioning protein ParA [Planctomycetaceae bacterium]